MVNHSRSKSKIKIVYFDFAVALGGSITVLQNTLQSLNRERFEPIVVTALPKQLAEQTFGHLGIQTITHHHWANYVSRFAFLDKPIFSSPWKRRVASYLFTVYSAFANVTPFFLLLLRILKLKPDLMHTHNGIDSMLIATILRIPALLHLHGPFGRDSKAEIALAKLAKKCICVSKELADMLIERGVDAGSVVVIANPAPTPKCDDTAALNYRNKYRTTEDCVLVAHVGRLVYWKGQLEYLKAFALVTRDMPNVKALVIGDDAEKLNHDYLKDLHQFVQQEGISEKVIFTGHISDIQNLISVVDIVVHSSIEPEPFGLVVTEAMALGKPVVAASYGATAEIVDHGVTGLLADPRDEKQLAEAISFLARDADIREKFGNAAIIRAENLYSIKKYSQMLESLYERAIT